MKCPYDGKSVHYEGAGCLRECNRYIRYCENAMKGEVYSGCPAPDICKNSRLPMNNSIHSIPLSKEVRL